MLELQKIATEQRNPNTMNIDTLSTLDMVKLINQEDHRVADAVGLVSDKIAQAVDVIADRLSRRTAHFTAAREPPGGWESWMLWSARPPTPQSRKWCRR